MLLELRSVMVKETLKKRVSPTTLEALIVALMLIFGVVAAYVFFHALTLQTPSTVILLVEVMILQIIAILGLAFTVLKVYEEVVDE